jgi:DNA-binding CsgD family transcriptional regulator
MKKINGKICLTARELEVLKLIARGETQQTVSDNLGISLETARARMKTLRQKLGAATAAEAVYVALKNELID